MSYPSATFVLNPREIELIINSLAESAADCEDCDMEQQAAEYSVLERRFIRASNELIAH